MRANNGTLDYVSKYGKTFETGNEGSYDLGYHDEVGETINMIPIATSDWYGEYEITVDDIVYGLEIAPCWEGPEIWEVVVISHYINDDAHLTSWVG